MTDRIPWHYFIVLVVINMALLLPPGNPLRSGGGLLLIGLMPGLLWARWLIPSASYLLRWTMAAALSYSLTMLATLGLHYLRGPILPWHLLLLLNGPALLSLLLLKPPSSQLSPGGRGGKASPPLEGIAGELSTRSALFLGVILVAAILLRVANLGYSEFQGDEALAMISAAEALEGHEDALFLRSKGPGEVLLPMALWRLTGVINEAAARLPFSIASLWAITTLYLIGQRLTGSSRLGGLAALLFMLNGFAVAFGRIVQYQALVIWLSSLAFLLMIHWRDRRQDRYAALAGLSLGAGFLAHYDAILVLPAIAWFFLPDFKLARFSQWWGHLLRQSLKPGLLFTATFLLMAGPFYLPYSLDPQANRTGAYVGGRIGRELRNNLPDFFHFNSFYSSFYFIFITTALVFGLLLWLAAKPRWSGGWLSLTVGVAMLAVVFRPEILAGGGLNLAIVPFALLLLLAAIATTSDRTTQALIIWLAVPFLGYIFVVALGLTHIYTIVPAWSLLAALAWRRSEKVDFQFSIFNYQLSIIKVGLGLVALSSLIFLWNAFIRHDVAYWQDFPAGNLAFFWSPFDQPPQAGFFGFPHRAGWKSVGYKISVGELPGDYGSNEEPDVTTWYTRGAARACDPLPEYYFLADDLIDPVAVPQDIIAETYDPIGRVVLANGKEMVIHQQQPGHIDLGPVDDMVLARAFDHAASPAAFARSARGSVERQANFANLVALVGYDLDTRRAYPGGRVPVTLYWQALAPIPANYQVFTHLESEAGGLVAQADGVPVCWSYPTDLWRPGQIIADQHAIAIPIEAAKGAYPLQIGFYLADTFERLDLLDEAGNPAGTSLQLEVVEIKDSKF